MWNYTDKVKDHFLNPRNVGEIADADGIGEVGSLACGDALKLFFKLDAEKKRIADARFKTFGCASAIASSSALTEIIKGLTLEEASKISNEDIAHYLGGLPKEKMHCSVMGREALEAAIANYRGIALPMAQGELVCECFGVTDLEIRRAIQESNLRTVEEVTNFTKAGGGCGKCVDRIQEIILEVRHEGRHDKAGAGAPKRLTNIQKIKMIEDLLEREVRPALRRDGGDIELIDVDGDFVSVSLRGACVSCKKSQTTLKEYVEKKLREQVLDSLIVVEN
ncbi:MAG: Fe-S cluster assembly protein NifU [Deltaproteobacteria bacterium CG23_combo_of_CG06-09_8_20_14_all_60_8]|nr:MAG: Fe-S cluster assembly protein NifU [Desulfobacterales bacterium CG2_30_60_27]PIP43475.1 MAG: Fe-S cluster assembly protein NifU [Deltaproteobacteria bacterium CG23_combo_of_CG06-09_8_20_14_all_60_8]